MFQSITLIWKNTHILYKQHSLNKRYINIQHRDIYIYTNVEFIYLPKYHQHILPTDTRVNIIKYVLDRLIVYLTILHVHLFMEKRQIK